MEEYMVICTQGHNLPIGSKVMQGGVHPDEYHLDRNRGELRRYTVVDNLFKSQWVYGDQVELITTHILIGGE